MLPEKFEEELVYCYVEYNVDDKDRERLSMQAYIDNSKYSYVYSSACMVLKIKKYS